MENDGQQQTTYTYTSLIDACGKQRDLGRATELLDEMRAAHLQPDTITYTSVIDARGKEGDLDQASRVMDAMRALGWPSSYYKKGESYEFGVVRAGTRAGGKLFDHAEFHSQVDAHGI